MNILRRLPTARLALVFALVVALVAGGAAVAVALTSGGPKPPSKPLPNAIRSALAAKPVPGVTASISFTNKLIDDSSLEGGSPLLKGASGRLWATKDRLRLELQSSRGTDSQIVVGGGKFWVYDGSSNTVYRGSLPSRGAGKGKAKAKVERHRLPTLAEIARKLKDASRDASISGAIPSTVAGQAAYTVRVGPKHDGGLLGAAALAWDAARGIPLRAAVYAQGSDTPVLELTATDISYGSVPASDFAVSPPAGAKVVQVRAPSRTDSARKRARGRAAARRAKAAERVRGPRAVAAAVPFSLSAPAKLVGLPRQDVRLLDWGGNPAAVVTYGKGLGGIAVIERKPDAAGARKKAGAAKGNGRRGEGTRLPQVSINGATGSELATALGTVVSFERGGVSYTVIGSVPSQAAEAAARGL